MRVCSKQHLFQVVRTSVARFCVAIFLVVAQAFVLVIEEMVVDSYLAIFLTVGLNVSLATFVPVVEGERVTDWAKLILVPSNF